MQKQNRKTGKSTIFWGIAILFCMIGILLFPAQAANGAGHGVAYSVHILVPSLFPFMTLSSLMVLSGAAEKIGAFFQKAVHGIFYLPGSAGAVILMSLIGGYPVGAKSIAALWKKGVLTEKQADRMLCFCVNSGPAFVITAVGCGMLGSVKSGVLLLICLMLPPLLFGVVLGVFARIKGGDFGNVPEIPIEKAPQTGVSALVSATTDASRATFIMCAFVILFHTFEALLGASGFLTFFARTLCRCGVSPDASQVLLPALLEVVGGCTACAASSVGLPFFAFVLGWGGLCIHFQIFAMIGNLPFSKLHFFAFRFLHGICSAFFVRLGQRMLPIEIPAFSAVTVPTSAAFASSLPGTVALLALSAFFLFSANGSGICRKRVL